MRSRTRHWVAAPALIASAATWGCSDAPTRPVTTPPGAQLSAVKFWDDLATIRWNQRAIGYLEARPLANGQAAASRILTYLSIAQYRAAIAAEGGREGPMHPSISAAVAGASAAVLDGFFPLDVSTIEAKLNADLDAPGWPGDKNRDRAAGEAIGRAVGASVLAKAATDNYLVVPRGTAGVRLGRVQEGAGRGATHLGYTHAGAARPRAILGGRRGAVHNCRAQPHRRRHDS